MRRAGLIMAGLALVVGACGTSSDGEGGSESASTSSSTPTEAEAFTTDEGRGPDDKVTLCHATGSGSNPYVPVTVSPQSILNGGHGNHPDDVIPPFPGYPGQNWPPSPPLDEDCQVVATTTSAPGSTTTLPPAPSTSVPPGSTSVPPGGTSTTIEAVHPTITVPRPTTTMAPPPTTPVPPTTDPPTSVSPTSEVATTLPPATVPSTSIPTTTPVSPTTIPDSTDVLDLSGEAGTGSGGDPSTGADGIDELPRTGRTQTGIVAVAGLLLSVGLALSHLGRRRRSAHR